mgnify:CR=1 FL=1
MYFLASLYPCSQKVSKMFSDRKRTLTLCPLNPQIKVVDINVISHIAIIVCSSIFSSVIVTVAVTGKAVVLQSPYINEAGVDVVTSCFAVSCGQLDTVIIIWSEGEKDK